MTFKTPPRVATWLLQHLGPRYHRESLAGDLFEEYQQGRSRAWYWRQVIVAVGVGRALRFAVMLPRLAASALVRLLIVTALTAGTLAWAAGASHVARTVATTQCCEQLPD
jgi:hypothetical protein